VRVRVNGIEPDPNPTRRIATATFCCMTSPWRRLTTSRGVKLGPDEGVQRFPETRVLSNRFVKYEDRMPAESKAGVKP